MTAQQFFDTLKIKVDGRELEKILAVTFEAGYMKITYMKGDKARFIQVEQEAVEIENDV